MKKATAFVCMMALCVSMSACGKNNNEVQSSTQESSVETQVTQESTETAQETTGEVQESTEETATEGLSGTEEIIEEGVAESWSDEMESIKKAVTDTFGENYWPNTAIPAEMLEGTFGITSDMYDDYMAEMPMISTNVDTLVIIKAKEDQVQAVEDALNAYRENLVNDTMQYPMNVGKIQASRIERIDNYVCFIQLGADVMELSEQGDEKVIEYCLEQNELAIEVIRSAVVK